MRRRPPGRRAAPTAGATCGATVDAASPAPAADAETALRNALGAASGSGCSDWRVELTGTFPLTSSLAWTESFRLHLVGPAGTTATLSGSGNDHRLLTVTSAATVTLERLVLTGGDVERIATPGADEGGAVLAEDIVLIDVELRGNAARVGGAVSTFDLDATRVSFVANSADVSAAGGGAVYALGEVSLTNVTLTGNTAQAGGALLIDATVDTPASLTATNVTFRGNTSDDPGFGADLHLITGNPDDLPVTLRGVLFAGTGAGSGPACDFPLATPTITAEASFAAENGCGADVTFDATLPGLPTTTVAFLTGATDLVVPAGSWAGLDAIVPCAPGWPTADQRGEDRPQGSGCDVGAVERVVAPPPPPPPPPTDASSPPPADPEPSVTVGPVPTAVRAGGGGCADGCPPSRAVVSRRGVVPARSP